MKTIAVYPGTFDPITNGHIDLARRASALFDRIVIGVANAGHRSPMLDTQTRVALARETLAGESNIEPLHFDGLLVDFAEQHGARVILRGLRAVSDFEYEFQLAGMNRQLNKKARVGIPDTRRRIHFHLFKPDPRDRNARRRHPRLRAGHRRASRRTALQGTARASLVIRKLRKRAHTRQTPQAHHSAAKTPGGLAAIFRTMTYVLAFVLMLAIFAAMAIGLVLGRSPIRGSCGGLSCKLCAKPESCLSKRQHSH